MTAGLRVQHSRSVGSQEQRSFIYSRAQYAACGTMHCGTCTAQDKSRSFCSISAAQHAQKLAAYREAAASMSAAVSHCSMVCAY
jgi:hypothetical protein